MAAAVELRWLRLAEGVQSLSHRQAEGIAGEIYREMVEKYGDDPDQVPGRIGKLLFDQAFLRPKTVRVFPMGANPKASLAFF
ncbi:hypothetical protein [Mesorhizobium sp. A623]